MQVEPYIPFSVRNTQKWNDAAADFGVHPVILFEAYIKRYFTGMDSVDFLNLLKRDSERKFVGEVREMCNALASIFTAEQLVDKSAELLAAAIDNGFCDLMHYRLKQIIEVGDEWLCDESKTYCFSGKQYLTRGERYQITKLCDDRCSPLVGFTMTHTTDMPDNFNSASHYSCKSVWRNGSEIWNWYQAYLDLWVEQNPGDPQTQMMVDYTAEKIILGRI